MDTLKFKSGEAPDAVTATAAARRAARRIAPVWPLSTFVAVNPFLGLSGRSFADAAAIMERSAGARMTMPRDHYLAAIDSGHISRADIAAARADIAADLPSDPEMLIAAARSMPEPERAPLPTVADVASALAGRDWAGLAVERLSSFAAAHFDEGQASWALPGRKAGFFAGWRDVALTDRTPRTMGLAGFRRAVAGQPAGADALIASAASRLGLDETALEPYFHRLAMTVGGWAAFARYRLWQAELEGGDDHTLTELLAARLAWDLALHDIFADRPGYAEAWRQAAGRLATPETAGQAHTLDSLLQAASEKAWQRALAARFEQGGRPARTARPAVQAAFCIDVRSEVFRRALERAAPDVETIGFAGFFGFPIEYVPLGQTHGGAQCPVLLTPKFTVREGVEGASATEEASILDLRLIRRRAARAFKSFKLAAVSSFAFVETMGLTYLGKLLTDSLGLSRTVAHPSADGIERGVRARLTPRIEAGTLAGRPTGFADAERIDMAEAVLTAMSMRGRFARIVLLAGHGSTTVNNPHASGLDCGACGGHTGEANARVAAAILNDRAVRAGLAERGIAIPDDTIFVGALHDTTTDTVRLFGADDLPDSHARDVAALREALEAAGRTARAERAALLHLQAGRPVDEQIVARSTDWAEVRPEWGLAGCAAFVAAPRSRTEGLDLGGRAFLHSYDWRQDEGFRTLELVMTAPMIVASWISLQYYGSTVDNRVFGSGDKTLHNVVGTIGVLEGNGGDLRTGLPWQSVHDGERLIHEPLRLSVVIEAPIEAMNRIIERHGMVSELLDNGWLHLFQLGEDGRMAARYAGAGRWSGVDEGALSRAA